MGKKKNKSKSKSAKQSGLYLVLSGVILLLIFFVFISGNNETKKSSYSSTYTYERKTNEFEKVKEWYLDNKNSVKDSLLYLLNSNGVSGYIQSTIQLKFDGDLGVYYLANYSNGIKNGSNVSGHARAFVKYLDNDIQWFSLEIAYDYNPYIPIVDWYKDEYDSICENYYYELKNKYK